MKKALLLLCSCCSLFGYTQSLPNEVELQLVLPQNGNLDDGTTYNDINGNPYKGIRVGEFYWMTNNINYPIGELPNSKKDIDRLHQCYVMFENWRPPSEPQRRDSTYWQFLEARGRTEAEAMKDFDQYYGQYYRIRPAITDGIFYGSMKENGILNTNWGLPSNEAVLQLLGMCGNASSTYEVKKYLSQDRFDTNAPALVQINRLKNPNQMPYYWWFTSNNNKYGLNFVPTGSRFERDGDQLSTENYGQVISYPADRGNYNGLNQVLGIITKSCDNFILHDYPEMAFYTSFHSVPARYCRPMTDEELGYKLYISIADNENGILYPSYLFQYNDGGAMKYRTSEEQLLEYIRNGLLKASDVNILKMNLVTPPPTGYHELQRGYIRGFYVQYILENSQPKTVEEIVNIALQDERLWIIKQNGELTINSTDYDTGEALSGGVYKIKTDRGNKIYGDSIFTTIEGLAIASNLPAPESYTVTEITPPDGYEKTNQSFTVSNSIWITRDINRASVSFQYTKKKKDKRELYFSTNGNTHINDIYTGVRIGEYFWMTENLYTDDYATGNPSLESINRALDEQGIAREDYTFDNLNDFVKYFGRYYSIYGPWNPLITQGKMYEGADKLETGWHLPKVVEFEQLFAMCGTASLNDVRSYLGCRVGDNPAAKKLSNVTWFDNNRNVYDYNMMPSGRRFHAAEYGYNQGDLSELFVTVKYLTSDWQIIVLRENHTRTFDMLYHWMNMRWCRKISDEELGYKLYINTQYNETPDDLAKMEDVKSNQKVLTKGKISIIKKDLKMSKNAPEGYTELVDGYLRGFYVQYFLEKPHLNISIEEIINYTRAMRNLEPLPIVAGTTVALENARIIEPKFQIYPNPVVNSLTVEANNIKSISIYTTTGQTIYNNVGNLGMEQSIDVSKYPIGIYIIQVESEGKIINKKFMKR